MSFEKLSGQSLSQIGDRLRMIRNHLSLTHDEFANKMGVSRSLISGIEANSKKERGDQKRPSLELIISLISMGFNPEWLLAGKGVMLGNDTATGPVNRLWVLLEDREITALLYNLKNSLMKSFMVTHFIAIKNRYKTYLDQMDAPTTISDALLERFPDIPRERAVITLLNYLQIPLIQHLMVSYYYSIKEEHKDDLELEEFTDEGSGQSRLIS